MDDFIILQGLGQSMKWQLPQNTTRCPLNKCREAFEVRASLISHYQQQHAPHMVLCQICNKPLAVPSLDIYLKHYRERHPNCGLPLNLIRNMRRSIHGRPNEHVSDGNDSESDEENDLLILEGCGQRMEYRFPNGLTQCPISACRKEFGIRASAIDHFKSRHSKNSIFCETCDNVVRAKNFYTLIGHYKNLHPDVEPPEFLKNPIPKENKVRKSFLFRKCFLMINLLLHTPE